jgi:tetratricopeptide (TPR) repeat protein
LWDSWPVGEAGGSEPADFFVSYTAADRGWAEWVAWQLEEAGHRVVVQAWDFLPGQNWAHRMHEEADRADRTIVILSPAYLSSEFGAAEWLAAFARDPLGASSRLLPVRVADCEPPGLLNQVVPVDLFGADETTARAALLEAARAAQSGRAKPAAPPVFPPLDADAARAAPPRPRFPGRLPPVWNVPARNPRFTGRAGQLAQLRRQLRDAAAVTVQSVRGMGGVGKTQLAIEHAHRHAADYDLVWWITAENADLIPDQFTPLAACLGISPAADAVDGVRAQLRQRRRWLLVFDNAETAEDLAPFQPDGPGHVLITTRRDGFESVGHVLELDVMHRSESVALLADAVPRIAPEQADALAELLGDLPLALGQAAGYLHRTRMPPERYLRLWRTRSEDLLARGHAPGSALTVATAWSLAADRLAADDPAALALLRLCAFLGPEPIPVDLFTAHPGLLPPPLAAAAADELAFADALGALYGYSLAKPSGDTLTVHRLVQAATRRPLPPAQRHDPINTVLRLLADDIPGDLYGDPTGWARWAVLLPHITAATSHTSSHPGLADAAETALYLQDRAATYLLIHGQLTTATALFERTLTDYERVLGPEHPDTLTSRNNLANAYQAAGRLDEAIALHERTLTDHERILGPDHPHTLTSRNNLAAARAQAKGQRD